jgi:hypothetical protein
MLISYVEDRKLKMAINTGKSFTLDRMGICKKSLKLEEESL